MTPIISIVGRSQSGKTTLIEKLIPELKRRGYRIGTIKHTHHDVNFDRTGKDSWRHRQAGADTVIVAAPHAIAMVKDQGHGVPDDLLAYFEDVDLVITEGYKRGDKPKIEVLRAARHTHLLCADDVRLMAVVSDIKTKPPVPKFGLEQITELADFIEKEFLSDRLAKF